MVVEEKTILVTGGAGYIGSHTTLELLQLGYNVVVVDNLSNSKKDYLERIERITKKKIIFYQVDIRNQTELENVFVSHQFDCCIHFAGLKAVGESVSTPLLYYINNVSGTATLLDLMAKHNCKNIIFSSSATVYGVPKELPINESHPLSAINPYGRTKLYIEEILRDLYQSDSSWNIVILRYFNPVGAHESGLIGEESNGTPNNLMPYIAQTAAGVLECLSIFGNDYDTKDGTGIRDYIHVVDLSLGHISALKKIQDNCGCVEYNLGTGKGYSVLEIISAFEKASGVHINYKFGDRRTGDVAECYADVTKSREQLNWKAERELTDMCVDHWRFQKKNIPGLKDSNNE